MNAKSKTRSKKRERGFTPTPQAKSFGVSSAKAKRGFTLIELLVVISIVGLLASVVLVYLNDARQKAKEAAAVQTSRQYQKAAELYFNDMGFYPPDVGRGWDPGISKPLPSDTDLGQDCNTDASICTCPSGAISACSQTPFPLPADWVTQVQSKWKGPYILKWQNTTPWGGLYDYNYWNTATTRSGGCVVPPGVYVGTQRDYTDTLGQVPATQEQWFIDQGFDADNCLNGEVQLILIPL